MTAQGSDLPETVVGVLANLHADRRFLNHIIVCDVLHVFAFVVLAAALFTASISRRVPRTTPWFLLVSSATLGAGSRILIVGQQMGSDPNSVVCVAQALLLNGTAILNIFTSAAFLIQFYLTLIAVRQSRELSCFSCILMQTVPILVFLGVVLSALVVGTTDPSLIHRKSTGMYCELDSTDLNYILTAVGLVGVLTTMTVKAIIIIDFLFKRKKYNSVDLSTTLLPFTRSGTILRALGYTVILFVIFVLGVASFFPSDEKMLSLITDFVVSIGSAVTAIVFSTESDILDVWLFWRTTKEGKTTNDVQSHV